MSVDKVCIYPCNGIGNILSSITRMAAYMVVEDMLPGKTTLLCLPALVRGVDEDIEMVEKTPTIIIDGCAQKCASNVFVLLGMRPFGRIYVPDVVKNTGLIPGESRRQLDEKGIQLAKKVAELVVKEADLLLSFPLYKYEAQSIQRINGFFDPTSNVDKTIDYVTNKPGIPGIYRWNNLKCCR